MGQLTGNNSALLDPSTGRAMMIGSPQQALAASQNYLPQTDLSGFIGGSSPQQPPMPRIGTPSLAEAATTGAAPGMANPMSPGLSKGGKLVAMLSNGLQGALAGQGAQEQATIASGGRRSGGAGVGFQAGFTLPWQRETQQQGVQRGALENQMIAAQLPWIPVQRQLELQQGLANIQKSQAEGGKFQAEAGKASAETAGQDYINALNTARASAERYKTVGGLLYDTSAPGGPKPVQGTAAGAFVPLDQQMAAVAGLNPGAMVPVEVGQKLKSMANEGIRTVSANGRSLLVDNQGNTIRDMGTATPLVLQQNQMAPGQVTSDMQRAIDMVGHNQIDLPTALSGYRRFPGQVQTFLGGLADKYPDYFQGNYGASKNVLEYFTSGEGAKNVNSFNTATEHLGQLQQLATALQNRDNQTVNRLKNTVQTWSGVSAPTNFDLVKTAVAGEIGKTFKGAVTDEEMKSISSNVSKAQSPGQLNGVISNALQLMRSKMEANMRQYQMGRQGEPAFPATPQAGAFNWNAHPVVTQ